MSGLELVIIYVIGMVLFTFAAVKPVIEGKL
jgi:hypothetical protein